MKFLRPAAHVVSLIALLLALPGALLAQSNQADPLVPSLDQPEEARQRQREADNVAAIASILSAIERRQAIEDQRRAEDEPRTVSQKLIAILWSQTGSNYVLAFFAAIAAGIGVITVRSIRSQIDQADQHFRIVHQQWLDVGEWSAYIDIRPADDGVIYPMLRWNCVITNQTDLPLTINTVEVFVSGMGNGRTVFQNGNPVGARGGRYSIHNAVRSLTNEQLGAYRQQPHGIGISFLGRINYTDALTMKQTQLFGRFCRFAQNSSPEWTDFPINMDDAWEQSEEMDPEERKGQPKDQAP